MSFARSDSSDRQTDRQTTNGIAVSTAERNVVTFGELRVTIILYINNNVIEMLTA